MYQGVIDDLNKLATTDKAKSSAWFFKSGPGQYGEGDVFIGVTVPEQRKIAKKYKNMSLSDIQKLLKSKIHEHRLTALFILVDMFKRADDLNKKVIYDFYLKNTKYVNNWDLVDSSASYIVGPLISQKAVLDLAKSDDLWERRIAMLSCFYHIKKGECDQAFKVIDVLKFDSHDLIQKAVGWMLREIGKKCGHNVLEAWLNKNQQYKKLPRTTLRYAIEHFNDKKRKFYLKK